MQHFYDGQIRRYITQVIRLMSNFYWKDTEGNLKQVPVTYGDLSRQVANIMRENSENKLPSAPRMAVYVTGLEMDRSRTSDSSFVSKVNIRERAYDANNQEYLNEQGKNFTVERLMPTPYTLRVQVDIWSTNTDQKLQILEQILMLFNPSLEIQTTDNFVDWTSLSVVNLEQTQFSNRTIPVGVETEIDVATLAFSTPIYISPPAKVKRLGVITNIITSIFNESAGNIDLGLDQPTLRGYSDIPFENEKVTTTTVIDGEGNIETVTRTDATVNERANVTNTYRDYGIYVEGTTIRVVKNNQIGQVLWQEILESYPGTYQAGVSQIKLRNSNGSSYIVGYVTINSLDFTQLIVDWDEDTLPTNDVLPGPARDSNSLSTIDKIIDPQEYNPTNDKVAGFRVLILDNLGHPDNQDGPDAWKNSDGSDFIAYENDIIEWDGSRWHIVFDASAWSSDDDSTGVTYISNLNTGIQYKFTGTEWIKSWEGYYSESEWHIYLDG